MHTRDSLKLRNFAGEISPIPLILQFREIRNGQKKKYGNDEFPYFTKILICEISVRDEMPIDENLFLGIYSDQCAQIIREADLKKKSFLKAIKLEGRGGGW